MSSGPCPLAATAEGGSVRLADIARGTLPETAAELVVVAGGRPGTAVTVDARGILRLLTSHGLANGVRLTGAQECRIRFTGSEVVTPALLVASLC